MRKLFMMLGSLVFLAGCGSGGGSAAVGSSVASTVGGSGDIFTTGTTVGSTVVTSAVVHNPEPSTLILLGIGAVGIAARALRKSKK